MRIGTGILAISIVLCAPPVLAQPTELHRVELDSALAEGDRTLSLEEAIELGMAHSPRLEIVRLSREAAHRGVDQATAALVPRLEFGARYAHVDGFPQSGITLAGADPAQLQSARALVSSIEDPSARTLIGAMVEQQGTSRTIVIPVPRDQFAFTARLSVPLTDILLASWPLHEAAEARLRVEELRAEAARADLRLETTETYFRYLEARGVEALARAAHQQASRTRDQIVRFTEAGVLGVSDRASAEARVAQAEEALARAEAAVSVGSAALSIALGTRSGERYSLPRVPEIDEALPESVERLEARAVDSRPELRAIRSLIEAHHRTREATLAGAYPRLGLYAYGEASNPNPRVFPQREEFIPTWELGASLSWSPNDAAMSSLRADEQSAQIARVAAELGLAEDSVRLDVRRAYEELRAAARTREAARSSAEAADIAYRARLVELDAGEAIVTEALSADVRVTEARLSELRADIAMQVARAKLARAVGPATF